MHPIHRVPSEILSEIFVECLPSKYLDPKPSEAPLLLAAVASGWRNLAIATPRLWSRISLNLDESSRDDSGIIQLFLCWLARSGGSPLSLDVFCGWNRQSPGEYTPKSLSPVLLRALNECSSRWQDIEFSLSPDDFRQLQAKEGLLMLRKLNVTFIGGDEIPSEVPLTIFSNAPALRDVRLSQGIELRDLALPMGQLHRLRTSTLSDAGQLFHILREAPNLVSFETHIETHSMWRTDVRCENLRSLSVYFPHGFWIDILDSLTCPALETLKLDSSGEPSSIELNHLLRFISRSSLRFLSIELPQSDTVDSLPFTDLPECLLAAPRLEQFSVTSLGRAAANDLFGRLSVLDAAEPFLPFLHTLRIGVCPKALWGANRARDWTYDQVLPMLVYRWNVPPGGTLAQLRDFHMDVTDLDYGPDPSLKLPKRNSAVFAQMEALVAEGMKIWIDEARKEGTYIDREDYVC
ncbi:hypothetical protein FB45DRAFT_755246 [Roridomyces roridus]|uniref:At1g61320/AtMIF1 LRR domain-containing protein n=1 Tax=Roridomyces roridus TaxID=1738132 RepID=A0AAD7BF94_9AGAR|nr:hypothetical protein FB45DRAFT_755246 [Roridomyces roridus]